MPYVPHRCSYPGCNEKVEYDLVLSKRVDKAMNIGKVSYVSKTKATLEHVYLCPLHSLEIQEFMKAYTEEV